MLKDAGCSDGLQRLEVIRKLNAKSGWITSDLYRLLFKPELYVLAYERIKSKPGNMTPGTDQGQDRTGGSEARPRGHLR